MDEQRLDTIISQVGEMRGDMRALNARIAQLEMIVERLVQARVIVPAGSHYWIIVSSFIIVALIAAFIILYLGTPR